MATTAIKKERMVRAKAFPKPPQLIVLEVILGQGNIHRIITNEDIRKALFDQLIKKAPGPCQTNVLFGYRYLPFGVQIYIMWELYTVGSILLTFLRAVYTHFYVYITSFSLIISYLIKSQFSKLIYNFIVINPVPL